MKNLRQMQLMEHLLEVLIKKIGKYTSRGYAANLIAKAIMELRSENECLNYVLINETRYEEGLNSLTVSDNINYFESFEFYSALKSLIEKTMECFDNNIDIHFLNDLRKDLPDIFYFIDNMDEQKYTKNKTQIMVIDNNKELIESVINGFNNTSSTYEFTEAYSGVQCFDLLTSGYTPEIIILNYTMAEDKGKSIFARLKNNQTWKKIPVILLTEKKDSFISMKEFDNNIIFIPLKIEKLKERINKILKET